MTFDPQTPPPGQPYPQQAPPSPVWPPPPDNMSAPPIFFPFKYVHEKVDGTIADFREGAIGIAREGITIDGRALPRAEIYQTILILTFVFCRIVGSIVAYYIMRYGCLRNEVCHIPWNMVRGITTVPAKNKLCLVYDAPNYAGKVMRFNLAMRLTPEAFASFNELANQYAPGLPQPGKLKSATSILLIVLLIMLVSIIAIGAMKFLGSSATHP